MENNNTEIDILELFVKLVFFFKKYLIFFLVAFIIGVVVAITLYFKGNNQYKGSLLITTNTTDGLILNLFESLSEEVKNSNVSETLNLSDKVSENILSVEIENVEQNNQKNNNEKTKEYYRVDVTLKDSIYFNQVKEGFIYFVENNSYIKSLNDFDKNKRLELISNIKSEILKFDSLRNESFKSNVYISSGLEFKNGIVYLYEKKNDLEKQNEFSHAFEVIKDFNITSTISLKDLLLKYVFGMLFLAFVVSAFIEAKIIINDYSNSSKPNN